LYDTQAFNVLHGAGSWLRPSVVALLKTKRMPCRAEWVTLVSQDTSRETAATWQPKDSTMTIKNWRGGYGGNAPGNPVNWTPYGAPAAGDTLLMTGGIMNIGGGGLAGDTVILQQTPKGVSDVFNLSDHAVLATSVAKGATVSVTVNVNGRISASLAQGQIGAAGYTVNLHPGATLLARYTIGGNGTLKVNSAPGALFENDGNSQNGGGVATINADVVGVGSFTVAVANSQLGFLEFGKSVAKTETVNLQGDPLRGRVTLAIDHPHDFHATINLSLGIVDLKNLGADGYIYRDNMLSILQGDFFVATVRLNNNSVHNGAVLPLTVERYGTDVLISAGTQSVHAGDASLLNRG